nr:hypothetical protein KitaXyl93_75710 [Kitasatospora sp. Xyl93]
MGSGCAGPWGRGGGSKWCCRALAARAEEGGSGGHPRWERAATAVRAGTRDATAPGQGLRTRERPADRTTAERARGEDGGGRAGARSRPGTAAQQVVPAGL